MTEHPNEEAMVDAYYAGPESNLRSHLNACQKCASLYRQICETLETASEAALPARSAEYGQEVWARVSPHLPPKSRHKSPRIWLSVPAAAAALSMLFVAGMWTQRQATTAPTQAQVQVRAVPHVQPPPDVKRKAPVRWVRHVAPTRVPPVPKHSDSDLDAKLLALNSLLEADAKAALPEVLGMINGNTSDRTKEHALFVLAQSDSPDAHQALLELAKQQANPPLQLKAVRMMGMMGRDGERKELAGLYRTSSSQALKREILNGLMFSGSRTALQKVASMEADPGLRHSAMAEVSIANSEVETPALEFKGGFGTDKQQLLNSVFLAANSQVLVDVLEKQPDAGMRVATIRSLAVMGEQSKILATVYRTDKDETVRRAVLDALLVQQNSIALGELARDETDASRKADILSRLATIRTQTPPAR